MAAPLPPGACRLLRVLRFADVLEDDDPTKLSWTKVGVAATTIFSVFTGFFTMVQSALNTAAQTNWALLAAAVSLHGISHGARAFKRVTDNPGRQ